MIYDHGPWVAGLIAFGPPVVIGMIALAVAIWREKRSS